MPEYTTTGEFTIRRLTLGEPPFVELVSMGQMTNGQARPVQLGVKVIDAGLWTSLLDAGVGTVVRATVRSSIPGGNTLESFELARSSEAMTNRALS